MVPSSTSLFGIAYRKGAALSPSSQVIPSGLLAEVFAASLRCAAAAVTTLLLAAGVQPNVVQRRLGHSSISTTLDLYAHVLPAQQADAAARLAGLLYGGG
jgi:integrase